MRTLKAPTLAVLFFLGIPVVTAIVSAMELMGAPMRVERFSQMLMIGGISLILLLFLLACLPFTPILVR